MIYPANEDDKERCNTTAKRSKMAKQCWCWRLH